MSEHTRQILVRGKLRITDFRLRLLEVFVASSHSALTQKEIESRIGEHDRITLYRTLKSFEAAELIHQVVDGSLENKYAFCLHDCPDHRAQEEHAHFLCNECKTTYCLGSITDLAITVPSNYSLDKVQLALTGTCSACN